MSVNLPEDGEGRPLLVRADEQGGDIEGKGGEEDVAESHVRTGSFFGSAFNIGPSHVLVYE